MGLGVEGGFDGVGSALEDVGVDHGGFYVLMPEEFLYGSYVVAVLEEVGGEAVAKGVGGDAFFNLCKSCGLFDSSLQGGFMNVMAAHDAGFFIGRKCRGRKNILPDPGFIGIGEFFGKCIGHVNRTISARKVFLMQGAGFGKVVTQGRNDTVWQGCLAVVAAFAVINKNAVVFKVDVFYAQAKTFHEA